MKKPFLFFALACVSLFAVAQDKNTDQKEDKKEEGFVFTTVKENPITSIKNQNQSGTCWCFSSLSFFESELIRLGKGEQDLCEMFVVHKTMEDRAKQTVRTHRAEASMTSSIACKTMVSFLRKPCHNPVPCMAIRCLTIMK